MPITYHLVGRRFGRLKVLAHAGMDKAYQKLWRCACDCGGEKIVATTRLVRGRVRSCGCFMREAMAASKAVHGDSSPRSPEYRCWLSLRERCNNRHNRQYPNYGGRGITVCTRWDDFENFLADMGRRPTPRHSIDRVNNDGSYAPENCRWATDSEQNRNRRPLARTSNGTFAPRAVEP